jgi:predicted CopG family antitoxin
MRSDIYIRDKCYARETLLIEMHLLEVLQKLANQHERSVSEVINQILKKEFTDAAL